MAEEIIDQIPEVIEHAEASRKMLRNKSFARKTWNALFSGESIGDIAKYVVSEVAVPAIRDMLYDMADRGIQKLLYEEGTTRSSNSLRNRKTGYTSYGSISTNNQRDVRQQTIKRPINNTKFEEDIFFENIPAGTENYPQGANARENADIVKDVIMERISKYGHATVAELMAEVKECYPDIELPSHGFTDGYYGWTNFASAKIVPTRGGVLMMLPKCEQLEG